MSYHPKSIVLDSESVPLGSSSISRPPASSSSCATTGVQVDFIRSSRHLILNSRNRRDNNTRLTIVSPRPPSVLSHYPPSKNLESEDYGHIQIRRALVHLLKKKLDFE